MKKLPVQAFVSEPPNLFAVRSCAQFKMADAVRLTSQRFQIRFIDLLGRTLHLGRIKKVNAEFEGSLEAFDKMAD